MELKDWAYLYYELSGPAKHFQIMWEQAYSHLSNKRDVTLTDFEKFHPPQIKIPPPRLLIS